MEAAYRSKGIGTILMIRGLARVDTIGIVRKRVPVRDGNEAAWAFYRKSGFFPRITVPE